MKEDLTREGIQDAAAKSCCLSLIPALWGIFLLTLFSGIFLMVYYVPTFGQGFSSVERLSGQVPFGWMIRRLHGAGGNLLLILAILHLGKVFVRGEYKNGCRPAWGWGVLFLMLVVWTNFTGFFLPLSQAAFWGTASVLGNIASLPWVGGPLAALIKGGKELGGAALIRFYSMHIGFAALMALFLFWHQRGGAPAREKDDDRRFAALLSVAGAVGILLAIVTFAPNWFTDPLREAVNTMVNPERVAAPWYLLFFEEALKFLSAGYPALTGIGLAFFLLWLILVPYLDRSPERGLLMRPVALSCGAAFCVVLLYFTLVGTANARYGERIVVPDRTLSAAEDRGARVYAEKNCAYCHQVFGQEGRREGPDLAQVSQRRRSAEWLRRFILNARLYQPGTTMPRYEIPLEDLEALGAYLLALDPAKEKFRAVERTQWLAYGPALEKGGTQGEKGK